MNEIKTYTCQTCNRNFSTPLKTLNLHNPTEPYFSCPYCLTKIFDAPMEATKKIEQTPTVQAAMEEKFSVSDKPTICHYHLGYLSERDQKTQIPDDCLVCKNIIDCMLNRMKA